jgi:hypothetical protein
MGAFIELLRRPGRGSVIWLDSHEYAGRLLAGGAPPWLDVAAFVAWQRKLQGLLKSSVASLPVAQVVAAWLESHPDLRDAMGAKPRSVYPLRVLLADEGLRDHLGEMAVAIRAGVSGALALALPSPRAWVALAYRQGRGEAVTVGADEADSGSVYIADFVRAFGHVGLDAVLLQEAADNQPASIDDLLAYQALYNVAVNYKWDVGLRLAEPALLPGDAPPELAFAVAARRVFHGLPHGIALAHDFWDGCEVPAVFGADFHFAELPSDANPENVLDRLASLQ